MAGIFVEIDSDIRKLQKIKAEIENVKKALKGVNVKVDIDIAKGMEAQLKSLMSQYDALVKKISEAEGKIMLSTKRINDASDKILKAQERFSKAAGVDTQSGGGNANAAANNAETASIQAQAKAYDELKGEIESVIGTRSQNIKRMVQEQNAIRLIQAEIKQINKTQGQSAVLSRSQQQRLEQLNNSLLTHKTALAEVRQSLNSNAKLDNAATTSMNGLSQSLSRMRQTYRELTEEERRSPFGKELLASINQADAKIRQLDASIGNHQRNIGNYASSWNGLDISIQQIGRELPSLAYGARTFFSAISNNIPILVDEIKRAKVQYDELKNSGQKAVPVWKQVVSSIFSWQTALTVGITLLTLYGDKVVDWVAGLFKAKDALQDVASYQQNLSKIMSEGARNSAKERVELDTLYEITQNHKRSLEERNKAADELQKKYPSYFGNLSNEAILAGNAASAYKSLTENILKAAQARAAMKIIEENYNRIYQLQKAINADTNWTNRNKEKTNSGKATERRTTVMNTSAGAVTQTVEGLTEDAAEYNRRTEALNRNRKAVVLLEKANKELAKSIDIVALTGDESGSSLANGSNQLNNQLKLQEQLSKLRRKGSRERIRLEVDLENQVEQARIDAMKDGFNKEQAQRELNNKKELQAIERQKQDYINKVVDIQRQIFDAEEKAKSSKDKNYKMQTFDASSVSVDTSAFDTLYKYILEKQKQTPIKQQEEAWNEYLIKYGNFQQKRKAIIEKYNKDIEMAATAGDAAMLEAEKNKVLEQLDEQYGKSTKAMADLFEDASNKSVSAIQDIIDKYETLVKYMSGTKESDGTNVTFDELKSIGFTDKDIEKIEKGEISIKDVTDAIKGLKDELKGKSPWKSFILDLEKGVKAIKSAGNDSQKIAQGATDIGNAITSFAPALSEFGSNIANIFGFDDSKITGAVNALSGLGQTASGVGQIMSGDIVGGAMSAVGGISSMVSALEGMFGADYSGYEKMKAQYEHLITIWDELINKKMEYIDINYGTEAMKAAEEAEQLVNIQISRQRQLIKQLASSGASIGSHSLGYRIAERLSPEDFKRISDLAGEKITAEWQLWDLSSEKIEKILTDEKLVSVLDTVNKDFVTYLQNIADYGDQLTEIAEKEKEAITGMSFDEFKNGYADLLSDLDSTNEDFADNFEKHLQNAIFKSLIANEYKDKIKELYDTWAKYGEDGLSDNEVQQLRDMQQQLADSLLIERDKLMNAFGWNTDIERTQQSLTMGYSVAASQDSVDVLNGQLNAQRIGVEEIKQQNINQSQSLNLLTAKTDAVLSVDIETRNIADETRDLIAQSYLELVQISENTGNSAKYLKEIKADIAEVKKNTSNL